MLPEEDWYQVNIITAAAPNLGYHGRRIHRVSKEELFDIQKKRIHRILEIAALQGNDVLILGAFGCGAFENEPDVVAKAFHENLPEFANYFETIEFAVAGPTNNKNLRAFEQEFQNETSAE
jgi:uncharacterized protein (TIGR02452 family)